MMEGAEKNQREEKIAAFLNAQGWWKATRVPLAGDASFRRYERLDDGTRCAVLMDAPPPAENVRPFLTVAERLHGMGYSAPEIFAADEEFGLMLLEDLGDATYTHLFEQGDEAFERKLYGLAVDLLVDLHGRPADTTCAGIPPYNEDRFEIEHTLFTDWYLPAITGRKTPESVHAEYLEIWRLLLGHACKGPPVLVLRDYHAENIMLLSPEQGAGEQGVIDFQDALVGHPAYDLVSLLQDARREVSPELEAKMLARYREQADCGPDFDADYARLGAQRNTKIVGIFARLNQRDGKPRYLGMIPRVWEALERDLAHPALAPVAQWFDANIPAELRARHGAVD